MLLLVLSAMQVALAARGEYERWWAFASVSAWFSVVAIIGIGRRVLVLVSGGCRCFGAEDWLCLAQGAHLMYPVCIQSLP